MENPWKNASRVAKIDDNGLLSLGKYRKETKINVKLLSQKLGCPVIETISTATSDQGLKDVEIGVDIMAKCYAQHKKHDKGIIAQPFRLAKID